MVWSQQPGHSGDREDIRPSLLLAALSTLSAFLMPSAAPPDIFPAFFSIKSGYHVVTSAVLRHSSISATLIHFKLFNSACTCTLTFDWYTTANKWNLGNYCTSFCSSLQHKSLYLTPQRTIQKLNCQYFTPVWFSLTYWLLGSDLSLFWHQWSSYNGAKLHYIDSKMMEMNYLYWKWDYFIFLSFIKHNLKDNIHAWIHNWFTWLCLVASSLNCKWISTTSIILSFMGVIEINQPSNVNAIS